MIRRKLRQCSKFLNFMRYFCGQIPQTQRSKQLCAAFVFSGIMVHFLSNLIIQRCEKYCFLFIQNAKMPNRIAVFFLPDNIIHFAIQPDLLFEQPQHQVAALFRRIFVEFQQYQFVFRHTIFYF
ncbi:MAG: hypothetical protein KDH95_16225 [Calditrichaeota bacterium]|nr:hypothetical protein [Calditrichota bacterium]